MLVDTHCHVNFSAYKDDAKEVIARSLDKGIELINVGAKLSSSKRSIEIAEKYPKGVYASVGLHPIDLSDGITETAIVDGQPKEFVTQKEIFNPDKYRQLALSSKKVVALGETGLDYFYFDNFSPEKIEEAKNIQREVFLGFGELAKESDLPLIAHCRGAKDDPYAAYDDLIALAKQAGVGGVIHCFSGTVEQAKRFLELGFYVGFTGIITFKKSDELRNIVKEVPLNRILAETDAPFLAPEPHRGQRNEPAYVEFIVRKIAEVRGISFNEAAEATTANARELFKLDGGR